jgi:hypothetical protein
MSVSFHSPIKVARHDPARAAEAYRRADRLGRASRRSVEWQRLCKADHERRAMMPFGDVFADDLDKIEDAEFVDVPDADSEEHMIRSAYLLAAVTAGTLCMILGSVILF